MIRASRCWSKVLRMPRRGEHTHRPEDGQRGTCPSPFSVSARDIGAQHFSLAPRRWQVGNVRQLGVFPLSVMEDDRAPTTLSHSVRRDASVAALPKAIPHHDTCGKAAATRKCGHPHQTWHRCAATPGRHCGAWFESHLIPAGVAAQFCDIPGSPLLHSRHVWPSWNRCMVYDAISILKGFVARRPRILKACSRWRSGRSKLSIRKLSSALTALRKFSRQL